MERELAALLVVAMRAAEIGTPVPCVPALPLVQAIEHERPAQEAPWNTSRPHVGCLVLCWKAVAHHSAVCSVGSGTVPASAVPRA